MDLPRFTYHPDPISTGSILYSDIECECCQRARGFVYAGPVYAEEELHECLCPWCIADGRAHQAFDASFTDISGIGGHGCWEAVARAVAEEVAYRTPGFSGWQQERWWTHCGDAAQFIGRVGYEEAMALGRDFLAGLREVTGVEDSHWQDFVAALHPQQGPTAYAFRCRHCNKWGGYADNH